MKYEKNSALWQSDVCGGYIMVQTAKTSYGNSREQAEGQKC